MRKQLKELLNDTSVYGMTTIASRLIGFFLLPLYTKYLSPTDYGIIAMLAIFSSVFQPLGNLGLKSAIMRFVSKAESPEDEASIYSTNYIAALLTSIVLLSICLLFAPFLSIFFLDSKELALYTNLTVFTATLSSIGAIPSSYLRIKRKVWKAALASLINLITSVTVSVIMVAYLNYGLMGAVIGGLAGALFSQIYLIGVTPFPKISRFSKSKLVSFLKYCLPYLPHYMQGIGLVMFGQYIVKEVLSLEQAGLYNIAWKFCLPLSLLIEAFNTSWGPYQFTIYEKESNPQRTYRAIFSFYVVGVTTVYLITALFGEYFLELLVPPEYHSAKTLLPFLALIPLTTGIYYMTSTGTYYTPSPKYLPVISFSGLVIVILLSVFLVPLYGANGAAIATAIGWLSMSVFVFIYAQKIYPIKHNWFLAFCIFAIIITYLIINNYLILSVAIKFLIIGLYSAIAFYFFYKADAGRKFFYSLINKIKN